MRRFYSISALALATLSTLVTSCKPDTPIDPESKSPTVKLEVSDVRTNEVDFTLTTTDAEEAYYYCVAGAAEAAAAVASVHSLALGEILCVALGMIAVAFLPKRKAIKEI